MPFLTDLLRPVFDFVFPVVKSLASFVGVLLGFPFVYYATRLWIQAAWAVITGTFAYLFTIQDPSTQFAENFVIIFGWVALFYRIWSHDNHFSLFRHLWMISVAPLIYNFIKTLVLYVVPIAHTLDPWSLSGWLKMMQDKNLLVMVTQLFAVGDLSNATLMLMYSLSLIQPRLSRSGLSFLTLTSLFMVNPLGLGIFIIWSAVAAIGYWSAIPIITCLAAFLATGLSTPESMFNQILPIVVGWIGLLYYSLGPKPNNWIKDIASYLFAAGVALPVANYMKVLFLYQIFNPNAPKTDFFSIGGWTSLFQDKYILFASVAHLAIIALAIGFLVASHFRKLYTFSDGISGKGFLLFILGITSIFPLLGMVVYIVLCWFIPENLKRDYKVPDKILDKREVHWGENLPLFPKFFFYCIKAVAGLFFAFAHVLMYALFVMFIYFYSFVEPVWTPDQIKKENLKKENLTFKQSDQIKKENLKKENPTFKQFAAPSVITPALIRNLAGQMRVHMYSVPITKRGLLWSIKFHILQFAAIVEIAPNASVPSPLSAALGRQFGGVFPFADGIGIGDRDKIDKYLKDPKGHKGPRSLAGPVCSSQAKFSLWSTITMGLAPKEQGDKVNAARRVLFAWIKEFDMNLKGDNPTFASMTGHFPPLRNGKLPTAQQLYSVFGDVLYWMATPNISPGNHSTPALPTNHGMMSRDEKAAFSVLVNNLFQFFPDWFNFMLFGGFMERQVNSAFYTMRAAIHRDKGAAYKSAMDQGKTERKNGNNISDAEVLRLIVSVFAIAGAAVPSKLIVAILERIASDPRKMEALYKKNPDVFIKECARLDPAVFWVNMLTHETEFINDIEIQPGTPCHLYIPFANLDPREFGPNPLNFDPIAARVEKIYTWNGLEGSLKTYPRGCPGHTVAIQALKLIVDFYLPLIVKAVSTDDETVSDQLDTITKGVVTVTTMRSYNWATYGHFGMETFSDRDLEIRNFYGFSTPTFDEDFRNNISFIYDSIAQCLTLIPVFDSISFVADEAAYDWRKRHLTYFPSPNDEYSTNPNDNNTDDTIHRFAFFGLGCHLTKVVCAKNKNQPEQNGCAHWKYVNDTTKLGKFDVRHGFVKYGAAAYFDAQYQPTAIFLSHNKETVSRPDEKSSENAKEAWEYAKWVWKVSLFTYVTIHDHLLECHLIKANVFATCSRLHLSLKHPLRIILKPFTYQTIYINQLAGRTLIGPNGLAARVFAFRDVTATLNQLQKEYKYQETWAGMTGKDAPPTDDFPLGSDYDKLREIVRVYIEKTLALLRKTSDINEAKNFYAQMNAALKIDEDRDAWPSKKCVNLLSELILNGTGIHEQVGQISDVQVLPSLTGAKLVELMTSEPIQSYALNTALTSSTGIDQPKLLDDWSYLFENLTDEKIQKGARDHYFEFKDKLVQMSVAINERNVRIAAANAAQARKSSNSRFVYANFDPRTLETAVSK